MPSPQSRAHAYVRMGRTTQRSGSILKRKGVSTSTKKSGSFRGKSNVLGHGGRAAQLKARGVPGWKIGIMARKAHAAPGQANYHPSKKKSVKRKASSVKCKACKAMHEYHS